MKNALLFVVLSLTGLSIVSLHAEQADQPTVSPATSATSTAAPAPAPHPMPFTGQQSALTPDEIKTLTKARMELQQDPELRELDAQIKTLIEKRTKLTEEKLQKINPEAVALFQKMKTAQDKMMAEHKARMEALQAKYKAQQQEAAARVEADKPVTAPATAPLSAASGK